ncbi:unnamed protein product [Ranitomeya imitator]|uniref:Vesicle tethering protein Uso1/P115-like head domain-containing protein n=1 Tax=Ranitomeya imitator TaxID=111125 RepID=A0ABN9LEW4_9NEOB|nr:unnamed protein product [Ranitomeya imitator]
MCVIPFTEENQQVQTDDLGVQFTEMFIKQQENVTMVLSILEEFDFHVRWPGVKLLTSLLRQQGPQVQQIILVSPMGVSRLMDLLDDSREVIRNDGLLLLQQLTKSNAAIQKIVAFENAFERLLDIITEEGNSDGGVAVRPGASYLLTMTSSSCSHAAAPPQADFVCPVEGRAKYCSMQALGQVREAQRLRIAVLCSALNRADKVSLCRSRSVNTRRGRHRKKMGVVVRSGASYRTRTAAGSGSSTVMLLAQTVCTLDQTALPLKLAGIVVEDCLLLLQNLLKYNNSNQNFFKEGSYIQRMKPWFEVGDDNSGWSAQKVTNLHLMLQLVRVLVSPGNPPGATSSCQKFMYQCGLLQQLCIILMATGVPADILTECQPPIGSSIHPRSVSPNEWLGEKDFTTINTVSEVIRGNQVNQDYFASVNAPSNPPRPAIVVLLMSMVNERQPFVLRCAVLYCFQCFLYKNQKGQGEIVATLLPSTIDATSLSAGQLLCGGLFSTDSLSNWCAAVALAHALLDNSTQKEQLLRVQLATSIGNPPVSLLQQCTNILAQVQVFTWHLK